MPDTLYYTAETAAISEQVAKMEVEFFAQRLSCDGMLNSQLAQMLMTVARGLTPQPPKIDESLAERLRNIRIQMLLHPEIKWACAELAHRAGVSESRLFAAYKQAFGLSPNRDLILIRLEKAKAFLQQGRGAAETAEIAGYGDVYQFIRQFQQFEGITLKRYAKRLREYIGNNSAPDRYCRYRRILFPIHTA